MSKQVLECTTKVGFYIDILHKTKSVKYVYVNPRSGAFVRAWRQRKASAAELGRSKPYPFQLEILPTNHKLVRKWRDNQSRAKLPEKLLATVTHIRTMSVAIVDNEFPSGRITSQHNRPGSKRPVSDTYDFHRVSKNGSPIRRPHYAITFRLIGVRETRREKDSTTAFYTRSVCTQEGGCPDLSMEEQQRVEKAGKRNKK